MTNFKTFLAEASNKPNLIIVDIQPEYDGSMPFSVTRFATWLNENYKQFKSIHFLYNGADTLGMISKEDLIAWLVNEKGLDENVLEAINFYDKGYAFFRYCMDSGIDEDDIVDLVAFMDKNGVNDSRELVNSGLWDKFQKEYNNTELRELLEFAGDCINLPDLMEYLKKISGKNILVGGARNECLKEVEIALKAIKKESSRHEKFIYESPYIQDSHKTIGDTSTENGQNAIQGDFDMYKELKKRGTLINTRKFKNYIIETWSNNGEISEFVFDKTGKLIGHLALIIIANKKPRYPEVSFVWVDKNNQGEGIGTELYEWAIKKFGGIISDLTLTSGHKGSYSMWKRLGQKYQLWALQKNGKERIIKKIDNIDDAMNSNMRLVATDKSLEKIDESPIFDDDAKAMGVKKSRHTISDLEMMKSIAEKYDVLFRKDYANFSLVLIGDDIVRIYYMFALDKESNIIGRLTAQQERQTPPEVIFPKVKLSFVYQDWQGKGVGKAMYKEMIDYTNGLTSDDALTGEEGYGSFDIWQSLGKQYYAYLIEKDFTGGYLSGFNIWERNGFKREDMNDQHTSFMVSKNPILETHIDL